MAQSFPTTSPIQSNAIRAIVLRLELDSWPTHLLWRHHLCWNRPCTYHARGRGLTCAYREADADGSGERAGLELACVELYEKRSLPHTTVSEKYCLQHTQRCSLLVQDTTVFAKTSKLLCRLGPFLLKPKRKQVSIPYSPKSEDMTWPPPRTEYGYQYCWCYQGVRSSNDTQKL